MGWLRLSFQRPRLRKPLTKLTQLTAKHNDDGLRIEIIRSTRTSGNLLVSTYVVCERLSVMHETAGVVEILVQILQNPPYSEIQFQNTPPENENCQRVQVREFQNTPPPKMKIVIESKSESFRIPPRK